MNLLHEIRTDKITKFRADYRWRTNGRQMRIHEMESSHLFYSMRLMVNRLRSGVIGQGNLYVRTAEGYVTRHKDAETIFFFIWELESRGNVPSNLRPQYRQLLNSIFDREFLNQYIESGHLRGIRPTAISQGDNIPECFTPNFMIERLTSSPDDTFRNGRLDITHWLMMVPEAFMAGAAEAAGDCERSIRGMTGQRAVSVFVEQFQRKKNRALEVERLTPSGWTPKNRALQPRIPLMLPDIHIQPSMIPEVAESQARSWRDMLSNAFPGLTSFARAGVGAAQAGNRFAAAMNQMNGIFIDTEGTSGALNQFNAQMRGRSVQAESQTFTADGATDRFEITNFPLRAEHRVFVDGIVQQQAHDYQFQNNFINFRSPPLAGSRVVVTNRPRPQLRGLEPQMIIMDDIADLPRLSDDAAARLRDAFLGIDYASQEQRVLIDMETRGLDPNDPADALAYTINPLTGIPIPRPKIDSELNLNKKPETTVETLTQVGRRKMIVDEEDNEL